MYDKTTPNTSVLRVELHFLCFSRQCETIKTVSISSEGIMSQMQKKPAIYFYMLIPTQGETVPYNYLA